MVPLSPSQGGLLSPAPLTMMRSSMQTSVSKTMFSIASGRQAARVSTFRLGRSALGALGVAPIGVSQQANCMSTRTESDAFGELESFAAPRLYPDCRRHR